MRLASLLQYAVEASEIRDLAGGDLTIKVTGLYLHITALGTRLVYSTIESTVELYQNLLKYARRHRTHLWPRV